MHCSSLWQSQHVWPRKQWTCKILILGHFWHYHCIPWPWKCGNWHITLGMISIGLSADGGHIGFLPIKKLAQGWQSFGTLNISLHVLTYHMVQKLFFLPTCSVISLHWQTICRSRSNRHLTQSRVTGCIAERYCLLISYHKHICKAPIGRATEAPWMSQSGDVKIVVKEMSF